MLLCWNKEQGDVEIIADPTVDCGRNFDNRATPATANIGNKTATGSCRLFLKILFMRGLRIDDVQIRCVKFPLQVMLADVAERKQPFTREHTNQCKCRSFQAKTRDPKIKN